VKETETAKTKTPLPGTRERVINFIKRRRFIRGRETKKDKER